MLHVNEYEAERLYKRIKQKQKIIKERAEKEELENKIKEEASIEIIKVHRDELQKI